MIEVINLTKRKKYKIILNNINFHLQPGKITGFLGPNGAGKSTTLRCMTGLDSHEGYTLFNATPYHNFENPMRAVGVMLDSKIFHPNRRAINHLKMYARAAGVGDDRIDQVLQMVGLTNVVNQQCKDFSLGMAQRLSIAVALLGDPHYVLLDEPANGLDPDGIYWLRNLLKQLAEMGKVVFLSSHLLTEISQLAEHIIVIGQGQIIQDTSLKSLIENNSRKSVFVRTENLLTTFEKLADEFGQQNVQQQNNGIIIFDTTTDRVSKLLNENSITPLELLQREVSLEEVYLNITRGVVEYTPQQNVQQHPNNFGGSGGNNVF